MTDGHMYAVDSYYICGCHNCGCNIACYPSVFFEQIFNFGFSFDSLYYDLGGNKFHRVACVPVVVLPGEIHYG